MPCSFSTLTLVWRPLGLLSFRPNWPIMPYEDIGRAANVQHRRHTSCMQSRADGDLRWLPRMRDRLKVATYQRLIRGSVYRSLDRSAGPHVFVRGLSILLAYVLTTTINSCEKSLLIGCLRSLQSDGSNQRAELCTVPKPYSTFWMYRKTAIILSNGAGEKQFCYRNEPPN
ncbi:hypothetical protein F5Y18DRAFT_293702 [Xylariaceae sp. FL1019]|nr:hypothetical protein F5Y18DRAFT_293702 [Xylariaceae sp. FL1019]